jgi:IS5 family transposase
MDFVFARSWRHDSGAQVVLHGEEDMVCGDSGYTGADKREELRDVDVAASRSFRR